MEKEKADLEQLLNSLIEKGWLPFGEGCHRSPYKRVSIHKNYNKERTYVLFYSNNHSHWKVLRQVVSKESGLWQFVCENKLTNKDKDNIKKWIHQFRSYVYDEDCWIENNNLYNDDYEYYIIESSLKDESELEEFLLSNIDVEGK